MKLDDYLNDELPKERVLQLASSVADKPWLCTVHFYNDEKGNIYWVSTKERRHSQELSANNNAVATVVIHEDSPEENYVISITMEGTVDLVEDQTKIDQISEPYIAKLNKPSSVFDDVNSQGGSLQLYCLTPHTISVFDNKNFPDEPKQVFNLA